MYIILKFCSWEVWHRCHWDKITVWAVLRSLLVTWAVIYFLASAGSWGCPHSLAQGPFFLLYTQQWWSPFLITSFWPPFCLPPPLLRTLVITSVPPDHPKPPLHLTVLNLISRFCKVRLLWKVIHSQVPGIRACTSFRGLICWPKTFSSTQLY